VAVEVGEAAFLRGDALEPDEHHQDEEGSHAHRQLQVARRDQLDCRYVGVESHSLRLLVDLEHVDQHLVQLDEVQLTEVIARVDGLVVGDVH
jgi:hypothetical protein